MLAGLSHGRPEAVPLQWGTELVGLQLPTTNQGLAGHCVERPKGLTLKLLNNKKKTTRFIEPKLCKMKKRQPLL